MQHITGIVNRCRFDPSRVLGIQNMFMKSVREIWRTMEFFYFLDSLKSQDSAPIPHGHPLKEEKSDHGTDE